MPPLQSRANSEPRARIGCPTRTKPIGPCDRRYVSGFSSDGPRQAAGLSRRLKFADQGTSYVKARSSTKTSWGDLRSTVSAGSGDPRQRRVGRPAVDGFGGVGRPAPSARFRRGRETRASALLIRFKMNQTPSTFLA